MRLNSSKVEPAKMEEVFGVTTSHPGRCPLYFCFKQEDGRLAVESGEKHYVKPSERLRDEVNDLLGQAGSYYAKVDTSLPDPPKRRWQKKESNGE